MKKIILFLFIASINLLSAQIPSISFWNNVRNSSYTMQEEIHVRCETLDLPGIETEMFFTTDSGWDNINMNNINGLTYEAIIPANLTEIQYCRFKTEIDTLVGMMPALQPNDIFPPEDELSFIAPDPIGDNLDPDVPNLDLTGNYFAYSDNKFYSGLTNVTNDFPVDSGGSFPDTYYFYITTIINPETVLIDSVVYAMIYCDVPFLMSPGLYKISGTEFSLDIFELIGSIEVAMIDDQLQLACDIETLTGDENFGSWPNITNSIGVGSLTAKYTLPTNFLITDNAKLSLQVIESYTIEPFINIQPEISGLEGTNSGVFSCTFFDENGHFPITAEIEVDGEIFHMEPQSFNFSESVIFNSVSGCYGWEEATFRFSDNNFEFVEETILNNTNSDVNLEVAYCTLSNYPNPFNPITTISFSVFSSIDKVELEIYNLAGQKIKEFNLDPMVREAEINSVVWDGTNENNVQVGSGVYFYKLSVNNRTAACRKMLLIK
ncbi:MAG: T9SS type A sorting domain-containing protein [Candidatus Cloacimonetes bacterium]|nr:T9SS type A sorting domain-containing protein [Candidatus Cloacimonadota bacterium]